MKRTASVMAGLAFALACGPGPVDGDDGTSTNTSSSSGGAATSMDTSGSSSSTSSSTGGMSSSDHGASSGHHGSSSSDAPGDVITTNPNPNAVVVANGRIFVAIGAHHSGPDTFPAPAGQTSVVQVFDAEGRSQGSISVPGGGHAMRASPDGTRLYLTHYSLDHKVSVIDTVNQTVAATLGGSQQFNILTPDAVAVMGDYAYVGSNGPNNAAWLVRVDRNTNTVTSGWRADITAGYVCWVEAVPGGQFLIVNSWTGGSVHKVDVQTGEVVASLNVGMLPHASLVTPDGQFVYVLVSGGNKVLKVRVEDLTLVQELTGPWAGYWGGPVGGAMSATGAHVFITNHALGAVAVVDTQTDTVVDTASVGTNPIFAALSDDGDTLWVGNNGSNTLQKLDVSAYP